jgi:threonine/homoserine/homoserine lactone efflux protein
VGTFVDGLLFGMILQLSVGPVCLAVLQRSLAGRLSGALSMVVGVAAADALYIGLAVTGISAVIVGETARLLLGLGGALVLAFFGVRLLLARGAAGATTTGAEPGLLAGWRYGFFLTLTNPLTILFWGAVFAGLYAARGQGEGAALGLYAAGCVSATLLFLSGVAVFGGWLKRFLTIPTALLWLNRAVGLFLIGFAVKLALGAW